MNRLLGRRAHATQSSETSPLLPPAPATTATGAKPTAGMVRTAFDADLIDQAAKTLWLRRHAALMQGIELAIDPPHGTVDRPSAKQALIGYARGRSALWTAQKSYDSQANGRDFLVERQLRSRWLAINALVGRHTAASAREVFDRPTEWICDLLLLPPTWLAIPSSACAALCGAAVGQLAGQVMVTLLIKETTAAGVLRALHYKDRLEHSAIGRLHLFRHGVVPHAVTGEPGSANALALQGVMVSELPAAPDEHMAQSLQETPKALRRLVGLGDTLPTYPVGYNED